ncbi:MAG TPA: hypothetical protein VEQ63_02770 [Bryobacteraceae bacterium]|nr:hypothetical protein [Bryobacteraceae bacterium]
MTINRFLTVVLAATLTCPAAFADFSYDQNVRITGGAMAGAMKAAGVFSKAARQPMGSQILVKGDRMATVTGDSITVIDLTKETFTNIDLQKKSYATITFSEMTQAMARMAEKMRQNDAQTTVKAEVKHTGKSQVIGGMKATESILTLTMQMTDAKSGKTADMVMASHMWMTPSMPGYEEVKNFYTKMAQKMAWTPGASGFAGAMLGQQPGGQKGMAELVKETSKLEGIPMLQVVRMNAAGQGMPTEAEMARTQQQQQVPQQEPTPETPSARIGRLAGGIGGLGGFGRNKKKDDSPVAEQPAQTSPAGATPAGTLIEMTIESSNFSSAPVDAARFDVPAGFKEVEHDMKKALK